MNSKKRSELDLMEQYRIAIENATAQSEIAAALATRNYTPMKLAQGKDLLSVTRSLYNTNITETDQSLAAGAAYSEKRNSCERKYSMYRKLAKVAFRDDTSAMDRLSLLSAIPSTYTKWFQSAIKLYSTAIADSNIMSKFTALSVTVEELTAAIEELTVLDGLRTVYVKELGESQEATLKKDLAFHDLSTWMSNFYTVARVTLDEQPQLLEAIGIVVKR